MTKLIITRTAEDRQELTITTAHDDALLTLKSVSNKRLHVEIPNDPRACYSGTEVLLSEEQVSDLHQFLERHLRRHDK